MPTGLSPNPSPVNDRRYSPDTSVIIRDWIGQQLSNPDTPLPRSARSAITILARRDPDISAAALVFLDALVPGLDTPTVETINQLLNGLRDLALQYPEVERWERLACAVSPLGNEHSGKLTYQSILGLAGIALDSVSWVTQKLPGDGCIAIQLLATTVPQGSFCEIVHEAAELFFAKRPNAARLMIADAVGAAGKLPPTRTLHTTALLNTACVPNDVRIELAHSDTPFYALSIERKVKVVGAIEQSVTCRGNDIRTIPDQIADALSRRKDDLDPYPSLIHAIGNNDPSDLPDLLRAMSKTVKDKSAPEADAKMEPISVLAKRVSWCIRYKIPFRCTPSDPELLATRRPHKNAAMKMLFEVAKKFNSTSTADFEIASVVSKWCLYFPNFRAAFFAARVPHPEPHPLLETYGGFRRAFFMENSPNEVVHHHLLVAAAPFRRVPFQLERIPALVAAREAILMDPDSLFLFLTYLEVMAKIEAKLPMTQVGQPLNLAFKPSERYQAVILASRAKPEELPDTTFYSVARATLRLSLPTDTLSEPSKLEVQMNRLNSAFGGTRAASLLRDFFARKVSPDAVDADLGDALSKVIEENKSEPSELVKQPAVRKQRASKAPERYAFDRFGRIMTRCLKN